MKPVRVQPYDPDWPRAFQEIRSYVWPAVRDIAEELEHIGSTAVPGLPARPVIDACIVVASPDELQPCIQRLAGIGFVHRGNLGVPDREAFRGPPALPRHHLYLSTAGSLSLRNHIGFRDYLRTHPDAARDYTELKLTLATKFADDADSYVVAKTDFIVGVLGKIGIGEAELDAVRHSNRVAGGRPAARHAAGSQE